MASDGNTRGAHTIKKPTAAEEDCLRPDKEPRDSRDSLSSRIHVITQVQKRR